MTDPSAVKTESILLRLRRKDTPTGISAETLAALCAKTGLNKTEVIHLSLREMALRYGVVEADFSQQSRRERGMELQNEVAKAAGEHPCHNYKKV